MATKDPFSVRTTLGRPPVYESPEQMANKVDEYFTWIKGEQAKDAKGMDYWVRQPEPPTMAKLCLFLGFCSRQSLWDYANRKDGGKEFAYILKWARLRIEARHEENLHESSCAGSIFWLKNYGWRDQGDLSDTEQTANEPMVPVIHVHHSGIPMASSEAEILAGMVQQQRGGGGVEQERG